MPVSFINESEPSWKICKSELLPTESFVLSLNKNWLAEWSQYAWVEAPKNERSLYSNKPPELMRTTSLPPWEKVATPAMFKVPLTSNPEDVVAALVPPSYFSVTAPWGEQWIISALLLLSKSGPLFWATM